MHPGIIRSLLSQIGAHAQTAAEYWKYGAWLFDARSNARALVEQTMLDSCKGEIRFRVQNDRQGELLRWLREKLEALIQRSSSSQLLIEIDGRQTPLLPSEQAERHKPMDSAPDAGKPRDHAADEPQSNAPHFGTLPRSANSLPRIFVSYAWNDPEPRGKHREEIVDQLCQAMQKCGIEIIRDKTHLQLGESIRELMDQIAGGDFIVAVISDKYLRSSYCMYELFQIYRRCADNPERFNHKLIPLILDDAELGDLPSSAKYAKVWMQQKEKLEQSLKEIGIEYLDPATIREYRLINEFAHNVLSILHLIRDRMIPRDLDRMAAEGFQEILKLTGLER